MRAPSVLPLLAALFSAAIACTPAAGQRDPETGATPTPVADQASTIDPEVARIAREELDRAVTEWKPAAAVLVVLDPRTGEVLASEGRDGGREDPAFATTKTYITGSTLKTITFAAALDAGTIQVDARVDCHTRKYAEGDLHDAGENGVLSLPDALAVSSNVCASRVYDTLGLEKLRAALTRFHFGEAPAKLPEVTDPAGIQAAELAGGERMEATPMQVAAAYAAVFNEGVYIAPSERRGSRAAPERVIRSETARTIVTLLEHVVTSDIGTGKLARVEGARVAGKTGTADLGKDRHYASFAGTVLGAPRPFVVLIGLEGPRDGGTGKTAAAPVFARVARRLLDRG